MKHFFIKSHLKTSGLYVLGFTSRIFREFPMFECVVVVCEKQFFVSCIASLFSFELETMPFSGF